MNYRIKYTFPIKQRGIEVLDKSDRYWRTRGFNCTQKSTSINGKRGSSIGNLTSFNMTKLICELDVDFSDDNYVTTELLVNGKFQDITEINLWDFKLELILFEYSIKGMDYPDFLSEYAKRRKTAAIKWSFTMMMRGRDFSTDLKDKLDGLTESNQPPSVEILS